MSWSGYNRVRPKPPICLCGLYYIPYRPPNYHGPPTPQISMPIQKVEVNCKIISDFFCEVVVKQSFVNQSTNLQYQNHSADNVRYIFPLEESVAVCGFKATLGSGLVINGVVKEKDEAKTDFDNAVSVGKKAALMTQNTSDSFTCEIGNLEYNETCEVEITYVTELQLESGAVKLVLPTVIAPRYGEAESNTRPYPIAIDIDAEMTSKIISVDCPSHEVSHTIDQNDDRHVKIEFISQKQVHYGIQCDGCMQNPLKGVRWKCLTCPDYDLCTNCHNIGVHPHEFNKIDNKGEKQPLPELQTPEEEVHENIQCDGCMQIPLKGIRWKCTTCADFDLCNSCYKKGFHPHRFRKQNKVKKPVPGRDQNVVGGGLNEDFVVLIKQEDSYKTRSLMEYSNEHNSHAVQLTFCREPVDPDDVVDIPCELIFLVDTSGSMSGQTMRDTKSTLQMFLRSLPTACCFNIIRFSNSHSQMSHQSVRYDQNSLDHASAYVDNLRATGGTNILSPLQHVLNQPTLEGHPRQVFLLTDGAVSNVEKVVQATKQNAGNTRVFTFGIGSGASRALCKGVARAGNGTAEFVSESAKVQEKVMRSLTSALQHSLCRVAVDWSGFEGQAEGQTLTQSPRVIPPVYGGQRYFVYGIKAIKEDNVGKDDVLLQKLRKDIRKENRPAVRRPWHAKKGGVKSKSKSVCNQCNCKKFYPDKWKAFVCSMCRHSKKVHTIEDLPSPPKKIEEPIDPMQEQIQALMEFEKAKAQKEGEPGGEGEGEVEGKHRGEGEGEGEGTPGSSDPFGGITDWSLMISGRVDDSTEGESNEIVPVTAEGSSTGTILHCLAARARIRELEEHEQTVFVRYEIITLGVKYSLASKYTSFVAVQDTSKLPEQTVRAPLTMAIQHEGEGEGETGAYQNFGAFKKYGAPPQGGAHSFSGGGAPRRHKLSARKSKKASAGSSSYSSGGGFANFFGFGGGGPSQQQQQQPQQAAQPEAQSADIFGSFFGGAPAAPPAHQSLPPRAGGFGGGFGGGGRGGGPSRQSSVSSSRNESAHGQMRRRHSPGGADERQLKMSAPQEDLFDLSLTSSSLSSFEKKKKPKAKKNKKKKKGKAGGIEKEKEERKDEAFAFFPEAEEEELDCEDDFGSFGSGSDGGDENPLDSLLANVPAPQVPSLQTLVSLQKFDGHWDASQSLFAMGTHILSKMKNSKLFDGLEETIFATCLALCILKKNFSDQQGQWSVMAGKARRFLKKHLKDAGRDASEMDKLLGF